MLTTGRKRCNFCATSALFNGVADRLCISLISVGVAGVWFVRRTRPCEEWVNERGQSMNIYRKKIHIHRMKLGNLWDMLPQLWLFRKCNVDPQMPHDLWSMFFPGGSLVQMWRCIWGASDCCWGWTKWKEPYNSMGPWRTVQQLTTFFWMHYDHLWPGWWWLEPWIFFWLSIYSNQGINHQPIYGMFGTMEYIGNVIIPTDELIFFRGVGIPPTSDDLWRTWMSCVFHARRMAAYKVGVRSMCYSRSIYLARKRVGCNLGYLSRLDVSVGAFLNTWGIEFCGWMALDSEDLISMFRPTGSELSCFQCLFPSSPCFFHTNNWRIYI